MSSLLTLGRWLAAPAVLGAAVAVAGETGIQQVCNCGGSVGGGFPVGMSPYSYSGAAPGFAPLQPLPAAPSPVIVPGPVSPPPGTLGRTYSLPSRLVPADKHPRVAMLEVCSSAEEVIVSDTKEFREEDDIRGFQDEKDSTLWHFETKPLHPGLPHVYKVELINGGVTTDVRYVRLLRGRIIELAF